MFSGNFCESKEPKNSKLPEIVVKETTVDAFTTMIWFTFADELWANDLDDLQNMYDVYQLSDRYEVLRLRQRVCRYLESKINVKDLISVSRVVFTHNNEEFMAKIMIFIESNINELIRRGIYELKELNDATNDKLLDVLISDRLEYNESLLRFVIDNKTVFLIKEALIKHGFKGEWLFGSSIKYKSFDKFKTLIGYLYFDKFILKDEEDIELIQDLCTTFLMAFKASFPFFYFIGNHLKDRITVENLELISEIAFSYEIEGLIERVKQFIEQNLTEISEKCDEQLSRINTSTQNSLLFIISKNHRKCLQNNFQF